MSIIIFIIILAILVFVHELGHFTVAKLSSMRVDEFGIGFPPRIFGVKKGETLYSVNLIPFGGFVKIFGEDPNRESLVGKESSRSFTSRPKYFQIAVLLAGVSFNVVFAWLIISFGFMIGLPTSPESYPNEYVSNTRVTITQVEPSSPADTAGFRPGDVITSLRSGDNVVFATEGSQAAEFIAANPDKNIDISIIRGEISKTFSVMPKSGIVPDKEVIGIAMDSVGTLKLPIHRAFYESMKLSWSILKEIVVGMAGLFGSLFQGKASLADVSGPVGIAGLVGDAQALGFIYLLTFTAYISLNLAIINLIPFPALDGGRVFMVIIEMVKGSPIRPRIANTFNAVGFALLLILMIAITYHDIIKLTY